MTEQVFRTCFGHVRPESGDREARLGFVCRLGPFTGPHRPPSSRESPPSSAAPPRRTRPRRRGGRERGSTRRGRRIPVHEGPAGAAGDPPESRGRMRRPRRPGRAPEPLGRGSGGAGGGVPPGGPGRQIPLPGEGFDGASPVWACSPGPCESVSWDEAPSRPGGGSPPCPSRPRRPPRQRSDRRRHRPVGPAAGTALSSKPGTRPDAPAPPDTTSGGAGDRAGLHSGLEDTPAAAGPAARAGPVTSGPVCRRHLPGDLQGRGRHADALLRRGRPAQACLLHGRHRRGLQARQQMRPPVPTPQKLLGSYATPAFARGDVVRCARRGDVRIVGVSEAPSRGRSGRRCLGAGHVRWCSTAPSPRR